MIKGEGTVWLLWHSGELTFVLGRREGTLVPPVLQSHICRPALKNVMSSSLVENS